MEEKTLQAGVSRKSHLQVQLPTTYLLQPKIRFLRETVSFDHPLLLTIRKCCWGRSLKRPFGNLHDLTECTL